MGVIYSKIVKPTCKCCDSFTKYNLNGCKTHCNWCCCECKIEFPLNEVFDNDTIFDETPTHQMISSELERDINEIKKKQ